MALTPPPARSWRSASSSCPVAQGVRAGRSGRRTGPSSAAVRPGRSSRIRRPRLACPARPVRPVQGHRDPGTAPARGVARQPGAVVPGARRRLAGRKGLRCEKRSPRRPGPRGARPPVGHPSPCRLALRGVEGAGAGGIGGRAQGRPQERLDHVVRPLRQQGPQPRSTGHAAGEQVVLRPLDPLLVVGRRRRVGEARRSVRVDVRRERTALPVDHDDVVRELHGPTGIRRYPRMPALCAV